MSDVEQPTVTEGEETAPAAETAPEAPEAPVAPEESTLGKRKVDDAAADDEPPAKHAEVSAESEERPHEVEQAAQHQEGGEQGREAAADPTPHQQLPRSEMSADGTKLTIEVAPEMVGKIIGKRGETIKSIQNNSGARVDVDQQFPEGQPRKVYITGAPASIETARIMVENMLNPTTGGVPPAGAEEKVMSCPKAIVGRVIGRAGDTIKGLQGLTGARIQIDQGSDPCRVVLTGPPHSVAHAERAIADIISGGSTHSYQAPMGMGMGRGGPMGGPMGGGYGHSGGGYGHPAPYGAGGPYGGGGAPYGAPAPYGQSYGGGYPAAGQYGGYPQAAAGYGGYPQQQAGGYPAAAPQAAAGYQGAYYGAYPGAQEQPVAGSMAPGGASEWKAVPDDAGRTYYYNATTGVSQWDKPPGF